MIIIGDQVCENFVLKAVLTLSSGMFVYSCWWTPERECNHFSNIEENFNFFQFQKSILVITLPHFSPGQGKWPGWWTSTWWAFIFPENFVLRIGIFNIFWIYQLVIFPEIEIYHLHKSSKTVIDVDNLTRRAVIQKNMQITSNVIFGITGIPDLGFHQDFP